MNAQTIVNKLLEMSDDGPLDDLKDMLMQSRVVEVCPHCGSQNFWKDQGFVTPNGDTVQNFWCDACRRSFTTDSDSTGADTLV